MTKAAVPSKSAWRADDDLLSPSDDKFVECIIKGMSPGAAARASGITAPQGYQRLRAPHIKRAIDARRAELRKKYRLSREQCVEGMLEAIRQAKLLADPSAQIAGWREIARMLGHYEPEKKVIELSDKREEALKQLQSLEMEQLMELAGGNVIDGEFKLLEN